MSKTITVVVDAKFPRMKPAHHAFINKTGSGTSLDRAIRDALHNVITDPRLKGKRADNLCPIQATISLVELAGDQHESGTDITQV